MFVSKPFWGIIDYYGRKTTTMVVIVTPELFSFPHSSKYIFCVILNKEIHTGLQQLKGE